jgi:hypothetical protein
VPHLEAILDYPVLRPDGTVLSTPGYDPATCLMLVWGGEPLTLPEEPTKDDAVKARDRLLEVVCDFPFQRPEHKSAWLASVLTPLARFAFEGPAPLFLVEANVRAAGKGLLLNCTSSIVTGDVFAVASYTNNEEELDKRITALAMAGERVRGTAAASSRGGRAHPATAR